MRIKILGNAETKQKISESIKNQTIEFVEENEEITILVDYKNKRPILGKVGEDIYILNPEQIIYFESDGNDSLCITKDNSFYVKEKLYQLEADLIEENFLRISRFHVVNIKHIKSIKPSQNLKFDLKMSNEKIVTVTRSYFYIFKEYLGL